jgi:hypothetical protein
MVMKRLHALFNAPDSTVILETVILETVILETVILETVILETVIDLTTTAAEQP